MADSIESPLSPPSKKGIIKQGRPQPNENKAALTSAGKGKMGGWGRSQDFSCGTNLLAIAIDLRLQGSKEHAATITINAIEAVKSIRSGMDDAALMEKFNISADGLLSLFAQLVRARVLTQPELKQTTRPQT